MIDVDLQSRARCRRAVNPPEAPLERLDPVRSWERVRQAARRRAGASAIPEGPRRLVPETNDGAMTTNGQTGPP